MRRRNLASITNHVVNALIILKAERGEKIEIRIKTNLVRNTVSRCYRIAGLIKQ